MKFFEELLEPQPDRPEPEGGWKKVCSVEDHTWRLVSEGGGCHLECVDPCTDEQLAEMEPCGKMWGCELGTEHLIASFGPFTLKWEQESYGWEYPNEFDAWVEVVEKNVPVDSSE